MTVQYHVPSATNRHRYNLLSPVYHGLTIVSLWNIDNMVHLSLSPPPATQPPKTIETLEVVRHRLLERQQRLVGGAVVRLIRRSLYIVLCDHEGQLLRRDGVLVQ